MRQHARTTLFALILPALVATVFAGHTVAQTLTADQVVDKHLAAVGGREALSKITSRRATGTVTVATPAGDIGGPVEMTAKSPNKMRAIIKMDLTPVGAPGEMIIDQMFDGTTGWMLNSMQGDTPMAGDQLEGAKNAYFPSPLLNYKEHGFTVEIEATQKVNDRNAYVLLLKGKTGPASRLFIDAESFMLIRTVSRIVTAQMGEVEQISEPSDYRVLDGVKVPFVLSQSAGGQTVTMQFTKIEHNVAVPDTFFVKK